MKKKSIIIIVYVLLFIISGIVWFFISFQNDKKETEKLMKEINKEYDTLRDLSSTFNENREKLYTNIFNNFYYDTLENNQEAWNNLFLEYTENINEIDKIAKKLEKKCRNVYYSDSTVNSNCQNFFVVYETINNYYVKDVSNYNKMIDEYNNNFSKNISKVELERDYIDFDLDGEYFGKGEVSE